MCPITPVPHPDLYNIMAMCPITHVPITPVPHHPYAPPPCPLCSCAPLPMSPITHVPYCPCAPLPYPHVDLEGGHATLLMGPITPVPMSNGAHRWWGSKMSNDVKLSKRCHLSKNQTPRLWRRFTKINWHHEIHTYWHQFWHHIWW